MDIKELNENLKSALSDFKKLSERQTDEIKSVGEVSTKTVDELKSITESVAKLTADVEGRIQSLEKSFDREGDNASDADLKTAGELFIASNEFKSAQAAGARSVGAVEVKDITSGSGSAGAIALSQRVSGIAVDPADQPVIMRTLLNSQKTQSGSIEFYVNHSGFTNNAGPQVAELAAKAKSNLVLESKIAPVVTIAHYVIASRQVLSDAPMLRGHIDGRLSYGLGQEEDAEILYGDGTGGTLTGIMNTAGIQDHGSIPAGEDALTHIRKAVTKVALSGHTADAFLTDPVSWADIELQKDNNGNFIMAMYMAPNGEMKVWRVSVYESTAITAGDFLIGSFKRGATLWDREESSIRVSDSHAELFTGNGVAILGEERIALTVERPSAFVKGNFTQLV